MDFALSRTVHMPGILLLVYVSALMFVMRHFAGPLVHKLSPIGLLWVSCLLASLGLRRAERRELAGDGLLAATVWGTGVCYMWPTMLATASERFPRGGALLMGLMGTAGTLSIRFVLPIMGAIYDDKKIEVAGGEAAFNALPAGPELERVLGIAAQTSFRAVARPARDAADRLRRDLALRSVEEPMSLDFELSQMAMGKRNAGTRLQVALEHQGASLVCKFDDDINRPWTVFRSVRTTPGVVIRRSRRHI